MKGPQQRRLLGSLKLSTVTTISTNKAFEMVKYGFGGAPGEVHGCGSNPGHQKNVLASGRIKRHKRQRICHNSQFRITTIFFKRIKSKIDKGTKESFLAHPLHKKKSRAVSRQNATNSNPLVTSTKVTSGVIRGDQKVLPI